MADEADADRTAPSIRSTGAGPAVDRLMLDLNYAGTLEMAGGEVEGLERIHRAWHEALATGDAGVALTVAVGASISNWIVGSLVDGIEIADRALELAGADTTAGSGLMVANPFAFTLAWRALCLGYAGQSDRALADFARAIELAGDDPEAGCYMRALRSFLETDVGDVDAALRDATRSRDIAEATGNPLGFVTAAAASAHARVAAGRFEEAVADAQSALVTSRAQGPGLYHEPRLLAAIARARLGLGDPEGALAAAEEGVAIMEDRGLTACALAAPIALAQVLIASDGAAERAEVVLQRALEVARESGARAFEPQIHAELAALARRSGDEVAAQRHADDRVLAEIMCRASDARAPSPEQLRLDLNSMAIFAFSGREREAVEVLPPLLTQALNSGDASTVATVAFASVYGHWLVGSLPEGIALADRALESIQDDAAAGVMVVSPRALLLAHRAYVTGYTGDLDSARSQFDDAIALARASGDTEVESYANGNRAMLEAHAGDAEAALALAERALEMAGESGNVLTLAGASVAHAVADAAAGRHAEALARAQDVLATIRERGTGLYYEPMLLATIAEARLALDELDDALAAAEESVAIMDARGLATCALPAPLTLVRVLRAIGGPPDRIEAVLDRAAEIVDASGAQLFAPQIERERVALARLRGEPGTREQILLDFNYAATVLFGGREREGLQLVREAHARALATGDVGLVLNAAAGLASANRIAGSAQEIADITEQALAFAGDDHTVGAGLTLRTPYAMLVAYRGTACWYRGDIDEARRHFEHAIAITREAGDAEMESYTHVNRSYLEFETGDAAAALTDARRGLELAKQLGQPYAEIPAAAACAAAEAASGQLEGARARAEATLAASRARQIGLYNEPVLLATITRAKLALGDAGGARAAAEEAVAIMDARGLTLCALPAPIALAQVLIATEGAGARDRVEAVLARAAQVARASGATIFDAQIRHALDQLHGEAPAN